MILSKDAAFFDQKASKPAYWNMLSIDNGTDRVVGELLKLLPSGSEVFEYGAGRGRNAIPLSEKGYNVTAQDIVQRLVTDLMDTAKSKSLDIETLVGDARDVIHQKLYDAFVIVRVLHFMQEADAIKIIQDMQTHTKVGGYNACVVFSEDLTKNRGFYFPTREKFLEQYAGWQIIFEDTKIVKMLEGSEMPRFSMLLQRVI